MVRHAGQVANRVSEWPFGSPWVRKGRTTRNRRPDRRARRPFTASLPATSHYGLFTIVHYCSGGGWGAPEQESAHRPPFSLGLTTSADSWEIPGECAVPCLRSASRSASLAAAPVAQRAASAAANANEPMLRKGNVLDCTNRGTFYLALTLVCSYFVRHEGRARHGRRRSPTIRSQARTGAQA